MRVKQFRASSMKECLDEIRRELGREAVILHSRRYRTGGFLGLFTQTMFEVTAAVETGSALDSRGQLSPARPLAPVLPAGEVATARDTAIGKELAELKRMIGRVVDQLDGDNGHQRYPTAVRSLLEILAANGIEEELREIIGDELMVRQPLVAGPATQVLGAAMHRLVPRPEPLAAATGVRRVIAMIGPTGVGKTTTIAKLSARTALFQRRNVALVTVDTYRIAAVEQLKTYGDIMGIAVEVASTPRELKKALDAHRDKEFVFIDTAGRSHRNSGQMSELRAFLEAAKPSETHLVLAANTGQRILDQILQAYSEVGYDKLLFTKLDETAQLGCILNTAYRAKKPLSYFTVGQSVPDDIREASLEWYLETMLEAVP